MKQKDIIVGETYATRVGPNLCNVVVDGKLHARERLRPSRGRGGAVGVE